MTSAQPRSVEQLLREITPQVLGALARRQRDSGAAEDATQEALLAASIQWPLEGVPGNPAGWLYKVALRRLSDQARSEAARRRREEQIGYELAIEEILAHGSCRQSSEGDLDPDEGGRSVDRSHPAHAGTP
jgi:predicted RNA polymerase sigma factor